MVKPRKGKAKVKITSSGKKVSYGQAGKAKGGGPRVRPGTSKGDSYCARSLGIKKRLSAKKRTAQKGSSELPAVNTKSPIVAFKGYPR